MKQTHRLTILAALTATVVLSGCGGGDEGSVREAVAEAPVPDVAAPAHGLVSPDEAAALAATAGITVIDVRTPEEFAEGHIDGAMLIDFYAVDFSDRVAQLDPSGDYLVYCRSGNRSGQAVAIMQRAGITNIYDLDGGVVAYSAAGLPLVK